MSFTLLESRNISELRLSASLFGHSCGMQVISLEADDVENMFSIGFSTVPVDNTGVTHIIEHSVLAGSRRYPVKDPFIEMLKGSMATFVNALTYEGYTVYPVSSTVPRDFFNLASVYFDAIFNPILSRNTFAQEGWHYEIANDNSTYPPLIYNGIVLNEMRGNMADIEEVIAHKINANLFAGTSRQFVSGGVPLDIPKLSYSKYRKFYREHYHPARARIFLYGNIPTAEKLDFIEELLGQLRISRVTPAPLFSRVPIKRWNSPRTKTESFFPDFARNSTKGAWSTAFLLPDQWDPLTDIAFDFIEYLLLGNASSPLRKNIMESALCDAITISGYDNETPDTAFIISVNGVKTADFDKVKAVVDDTLRDVAENGFSRQQLETAFTQFKLNRKLISSDYVFSLMEKTFDAWCFNLSPFLFLDYNTTIDNLEKHIQNSPEWLRSLVKTWLVDNKHRFTLNLIPDKKLASKLKSLEDDRLRTVFKKLGPMKICAINLCATTLKFAQSHPNTPEALASLPTLSRKDVPPDPVRIPKSITTLSNGIDFINIDLFSNGISQLVIAFPLDDFMLDNYSELSLFTSLFPRVGTAAHPYDAIAADFAAAGASLFMSSSLNDTIDTPTQYKATVSISLTALDEHFPRAIELLQHKLTQTVFTERNRLASIFAESARHTFDALPSLARSFADCRSAVGLHPLCDITEQLLGITSLKAIHERAVYFRKLYPELLPLFNSFLKSLAETTPSVVSFIGSDNARRAALDFLTGFQSPVRPLTISRLPRGADITPCTARHEAMKITADVSACARSFRAPKFSAPEAIPLIVFANILSCGMLWKEIRLKGGAYGTSAALLKHGCFTIGSSQDPTPDRTFKIFDTIPKLPLTLSDRDIDNAVISTVKTFHKPLRPSWVPVSALGAFISGITDDWRTQRHNSFLSLTRTDITDAVARFWDDNASTFNDCVIGPKDVTKKLKFQSISPF